MRIFCNWLTFLGLFNTETVGIRLLFATSDLKDEFFVQLTNRFSYRVNDFTLKLSRLCDDDYTLLDSMNHQNLEVMFPTLRIS